MRIIILGPPGIGKGTQANFIVKNYNIPKISTGDILRKIVKKNDPIGKLINAKLKTGELIQDSIICNLIKKRILKKDCDNGFLLDGFPRNLSQSIVLKNEKVNIDYVIEITADTDVLLTRIQNRLIHIPSGRTYHYFFNPPKKTGKDDITGEKLDVRNDDKNEIFQFRLREYNKQINVVSNFYLKESKKNNLKYFKINGNNSIIQIKKEIEKIINKKT